MEAAVETVSVVEPDVVREAGLNDAVVFVGKPLTENVTAPEKPDPGVKVTVNGVAPPGATVCEAGVADKENEGWTVIVLVAGVALVRSALSVTVRKAVYVPGVE